MLRETASFALTSPILLAEANPGVLLLLVVAENETQARCLAEVGVAEVGVAEVGVAEVGVAEVGVAEVGVAE